MLVGQIPDCVLQRELLPAHRPNLGQNPDLETAHREQKLGVVLREDTNKSVFPLNGGERPRETLLDVPEHRTTKVDVVLDEAHAAVARPALAIRVADEVGVVGIRVGAEVALDEVARLLRSEAEEDVYPVDITRVEADGVTCLRSNVAVLQEVVRHLRGTSHLARALQAENEQIQDETIVLEDEGGELKSADEAVRVRVGHV